MCCATFPHVETSYGNAEYIERDYLCYDRRILSRQTGFNPYRQAFCDGGGFYSLIGLSAAFSLILITYLF